MDDCYYFLSRLILLLAFKFVELKLIFQSSNGAAGGSDSDTRNDSQKVPDERQFKNCTTVDDMTKGSSEKEKPISMELQQHVEAIVKGFEQSTPCTEGPTYYCLRCGESVEERLPHVLETHLKTKMFECRECHFSSFSRPKDVFDHISIEHPNVSLLIEQKEIR